MAAPSPSPIPCGRLIGPRIQALVMGLAESRRLRAGERLMEEGDPPVRFGIVLEGRLRIVCLGPEGRDVTLHVAEPGEVFGLIPALDGAPYPATVEGLEEGRVGIVRTDRFLAALERDPQALLEALRVFGSRIRHLVQATREHALEKVPTRIATRLLEIAGDQDEVLVTRQQLADLAATRVETAIRVTRAWEKRGLLRLSRGRIRILDRRALALEASTPTVLPDLPSPRRPGR